MENHHEHDLTPEPVDNPTPDAVDTATEPETATVAEAEAEAEAESKEVVGQPQRDEAEIAAMVAQAEQRGYLRGRNEAIENALSGPGLWQLATDEGEPVGHEPEVPILQALRPSVWDL